MSQLLVAGHRVVARREDLEWGHVIVVGGYLLRVFMRKRVGMIEQPMTSAAVNIASSQKVPRRSFKLPCGNQYPPEKFVPLRDPEDALVVGRRL